MTLISHRNGRREAPTVDLFPFGAGDPAAAAQDPAFTIAPALPADAADHPTPPQAPAPPAAVDPIRRRQRGALFIAVMCAVISTAGLVASTLVESPQEQRASAGAPPASILNAVVERRVLESVVISRGTVTAATRLEVTPVVEGAKAQVVTRVAAGVGDEVQGGQVLAAVSGRPLVVLPGRVPAYRDLKPGSSGNDIKQLQEALEALGHGGGDQPGYFGEVTKRAVVNLYSHIGYDVPSSPDDAADLAGARDAVETAQQQLNAMQRRIDSGEPTAATEEPLSAQLARLQLLLNRARQSRDQVVARTGAMMPLSEFVFVPEFPARVTALSAKVGDRVTAPLVTLAAGKLSVTARARPEQAGLLRPGMKALLVSETLGQSAEATVSAIGEMVAGTQGGQEAHRAVTVTPVEPLPTQWAGLDVRVTITSSRTEAEVLVVPLSAVSAGADGRTTVSVLDPAGVATRVEVRAGISGAGFVEVTPVGGGLAAGDRVVVSAQR